MSWEQMTLFFMGTVTERESDVNITTPSPDTDGEDMAKALYWSTLKMYEECPQKCLWTRGYGDIDLGAGPGKPKPIDGVPRSEHHLLMGCVIADVMERLYNDELWRHPKTLKESLANLVDTYFQMELEKRYINWNECTMDELKQTCLDSVLNYITTMKRNKLLGEYAKAEVNLRSQIDKYNPVGGRADLIIRREDTGITIYDGKNSKHIGKYTDPDQLRWYAMCFYLAYNQMPDRLAFIYFRYPHGAPSDDWAKAHPGEDWSGLVFVDFNKEDLKALAARAVEVGKGMWKQKFDPTPTPKVCRFCDFEDVCESRQKQKKANSRKYWASRRKKKPLAVETELNNKTEDSEPTVFFGFDGIK